MQVVIRNMAGEQVDEWELSAEIFEAPINTDLMHQALVRQLANARQGTHKAKSRSEINRSKSKWYRQKGTGRARHGSRNAPIFIGGGVAHGPTPRSYRKKMPRNFAGSMNLALPGLGRPEMAIKSKLICRQSSPSVVSVYLARRLTWRGR